MKLTVEKGELILPEDFSFELEFNHPFFSDEGSSSIPVEIPACPENLAMLGFPSRLASKESKVLSVPASLTCGYQQILGDLLIGGVSKESITCVFTFRESTMHTMLCDKNIKSLLKELTRPINHIATKITDGTMTIYDIITSEIAGEDVVSLYYPGCTAFTVAITADAYGFDTINETREDGGLVCESRIYTANDGSTMEVPQAFGLSLFVSLGYLLKAVLKAGGYEVEYNVFDNPPYDNLIVLNNCADALVGSSLHYADLVPEITVGELLTWIKDKFGAYVCVTGKSASIFLIKDLLSPEIDDPETDLTPYADPLSENIRFPEVKHLEIDCDKSLEGAAPPIDGSIEDYLESLDYDVFLMNSTTDKVVLDYKAQTVLWPIRSEIVKRAYKSLYDKTTCYSRLGSMAFKYSRKGPLATEERKTEDRFTPAVWRGVRYVPYIGDPIYLHTSVQGEESKDKKQAIIVCWRCQDKSGVYGSPVPQDWPYERQASPLTPDGIYHTFWRQYGKLCLAGTPDIEIDRPTITFSPDSPLLDFTTRKAYRNLAAVLKSYTVSINRHGAAVTKLTLLPIPHSAFTINDKDALAPECMEWRYHNNIPPQVATYDYFEITDELSDLTTESATESIRHVGQHFLARLREGSGGYPGCRAHTVRWYDRFVAVFKEDKHVL